jgi:hypothetical protein
VSGPEHYLEAERLLEEAWKAQGQARVELLTAADAHATLAHAAASVVRVSGGCQETLNVSGWTQVLTTPRNAS